MQRIQGFFRRHPRLALSLVGASLLPLGFIGGAAAQRIGIIGEGWLLPPRQGPYDAEMLMNLEIGGTMDTVMLNGPTIIERGDPMPGVGGSTVETEILKMDLQGTSEQLGPVRVMLSSMSPSRGMIQGQADPDGDLLFPAESFFDVFVEVSLPDQNLTLHNADPLRLVGQASDEHLPDDEHAGGGAPLLNENREMQGQIGAVRFVPKPPLERKVSRVIVKKLNKVIKYVLLIQPTEPPPPPPEVLVASKSIKVIVPPKKSLVVGAGGTTPIGVITPDVLVENPFRRDANVKICIDAVRAERKLAINFLLDIAGDGDFQPHSFVDGEDLDLIQNTCFITATREFQVQLVNPKKKDIPVELAIIWTTGQVIP